MMANKALLDTSYLLALELARDQNHNAAIEHWQRIVSSPIELVTTSFILMESLTFLNSRGHHAKAVDLGNNLLQSLSVQFIHVDTTLFLEAWAYFQKHNDKDYSLADCVSFLVMRNMDIGTALTFDKHFTQAGFLMEPQTI